MATSTLEVADIFRSFGDSYRRRFHPSEESRRVMWAIEHCRTAALGGHLYVCDGCGKEQPRYNSCRNRHCLKCQSLASAAWLEARQRELLPVGYFHVVFTVPSLLRALFVRNPRRLYNLLFTTAWEALRSVAANERHLGARIGARPSSGASHLRPSSGAAIFRCHPLLEEDARCHLQVPSSS